MFKYWRKFPRFSIDLDFWIDINWKKYINLIDLLIEELKLNIEKVAINNKINIDSTFKNWKKMIFNWEIWTRELKVDYMYDYILWKEICCWINKISDLDIFINKLFRLSNTDLIDINFLYHKNKFSVNEIMNWIIKKSVLHKNNKNKALNKVAININNIKNLKNFKFLLKLKNEISKTF